MIIFRKHLASRSTRSEKKAEATPKGKGRGKGKKGNTKANEDALPLILCTCIALSAMAISRHWAHVTAIVTCWFGRGISH